MALFTGRALGINLSLWHFWMDKKMALQFLLVFNFVVFNFVLRTRPQLLTLTLKQGNSDVKTWFSAFHLDLWPWPSIPAYPYQKCNLKLAYLFLSWLSFMVYPFWDLYCNVPRLSLVVKSWTNQCISKAFCWALSLSVMGDFAGYPMSLAHNNIMCQQSYLVHLYTSIIISMFEFTW